MVGVGAMGGGILERYKLAGLQVTVYDSAAAALEQAKSMNARIAPSPAAVAGEATLIHVVVSTDDEVFRCVTGKDGLLEGAEPGTLILLHSTILPQTTRKTAEAALSREVDVIDACMVGVPRVLKGGNLTFLVGGPALLVERARPYLLQIGKQVLHVGPLGAANVAKLLRNLVTGAETLVIHEALQLGESAGLQYREVLEMLRRSSPGSILDHWADGFDPSGAGLRPRVGSHLFRKDIPLAAELAKQYGLRLPILEHLVAAAGRLGREKGSA